MMMYGQQWSRLKSLLYALYFMLFPRFVKGLLLINAEGDMRAVIPFRPQIIEDGFILHKARYLNLFGWIFVFKTIPVESAELSRFTATANQIAQAEKTDQSDQPDQ